MSRAAKIQKHVSSLQAARMHQCYFLEVDLPEVQLKGLADPSDTDIPMKSSDF